MAEHRFPTLPCLLVSALLCVAGIGPKALAGVTDDAGADTAETNAAEATEAQGVAAADPAAAPASTDPAADPADADGGDPLPSLEELLGRGAEDPQDYEERCISTRSIRSHRVLDAQHLVFEMRRGELFLVQFPRRCFGLRRGDPISYRTSGARLCKLDNIRPLQLGGRGFEPGFPCYIPGFQRVTQEQLDFLAEELRDRRRRR